MRRSIKVLPGVRLNVSTKSAGVTVGGRYARYTANSSGRLTTSYSLPGSGFSYQKVEYAKGSRGSTSAGPPRPATPTKLAPPPVPPKPSLVAPAWEKALYKELKGNPTSTTLEAVAAAHSQAQPVIALYEAFSYAWPAQDMQRVRQLLAWLNTNHYDPAADPFVNRYRHLFPEGVPIPIAVGIEAAVPLTSAAISLALAEAHQALQEPEQAIAVVESMEPTTIAAVSLAELYAQTERWDSLIDLTNDLVNDDDAATFLLIQRSVALRHRQLHEAARESLKLALRPRSRSQELRHLALFERGHTYLAEGKKAQARKAFERILASTTEYPGLNEIIAALKT